MTVTIVISNVTVERLVGAMNAAKVPGYATAILGTTGEWGVEPGAAFTTAVKTAAESEHAIKTVDALAREVGERYTVVTIAGPKVGTVTLLHAVNGPRGGDQILG